MRSVPFAVLFRSADGEPVEVAGTDVTSLADVVALLRELTDEVERRCDAV